MPCTGASAILLTSENVSKTMAKSSDTPTAITIKGMGQKTTSASFTKNFEALLLDAVSTSARMAYFDAEITSSKVDVAEVHDAFAVCEPMILESIGMAKEGRGMEFIKELIANNNDRMVNPRGGLLGTGHALGATGIAQTIEIVQQLEGSAKNRQVPGATVGLVQNMSAAATSSSVLILEAS
jgi:acetyl-CoA C-acetyltransferase